MISMSWPMLIRVSSAIVWPLSATGSKLMTMPPATVLFTASRSEPAPLSAVFVTMRPTSTAPISTLVPKGSSEPRWSVVRPVAAALSPASIAGLPASGNIVCVRPP